MSPLQVKRIKILLNVMTFLCRTTSFDPPFLCVHFSRLARLAVLRYDTKRKKNVHVESYNTYINM
jgi:hypothetical protein